MQEKEKPHILVIEACFYEDLSKGLWQGVETVFKNQSVTWEKVAVNGALEIAPVILHASQKTSRFTGYLALGCVIQGETDHFNVVVNESNRALTDLALNHSLLIGNGIITAYTPQQAYDRADATQKDKGGEAAKALLKLIQTVQEIA